MNRREFLETSAGAAGAAVFAWPVWLQAQPAWRAIGIQVGAVSFLDEGTDTVLDRLADMAAIDTLFLATFTYGRGIGGRQPRGTPLPDHGKQEYDDNYHGRTKIWPGIEIDVPTGADEKKTTPDDVYQAVTAAFAGGAHGLILSRKYSEMRSDNLRAAGRAIREQARK